jgi:hypothetical protein
LLIRKIVLMPGGQEARDKCRGWILEAIQEMLKVDIR